MERVIAIRPQDVKSPREHWLLIDVLVEVTDWSIALGEWDGRRVLAMRWNGDDERPKGEELAAGACRADLDALIAQITDENRHPEVGTGAAVGREFS